MPKRTQSSARQQNMQLNLSDVVTSGTTAARKLVAPASGSRD